MAKLTGHPHLAPSATNKLTIQSVDPMGDPITANFNPKEIQITKKVPWEKSKSSKGDMPALEFTAAEAETMSVELFFDTYETKEDVYETYIVGLRALCLVNEGATGEKKRPPLVVVAWGNKKFLNFRGVINNLAVKYTMFLPDGTPVRATATVSLQAAAKVKAKVPPPKPPPNPTPAPAPTGT
jgi:hypothetical protein